MNESAQLIGELQAGHQALATQHTAMADRIGGLLGQVPPPVDPPPPTPDPAVLLSVRKDLILPQSEGNDRSKLRAIFDIPLDLPKQGFWANKSTTMEVLSGGIVRLWLDKARLGEGGHNTGGSSWSNAAIPLARTVSAAELSFTLRYGADGSPWGWGRSFKNAGLMRWVQGKTPGGGIIGAGNWSARMASSDWNQDGKGVAYGPYVYSQHVDDLPNALWSKYKQDGSLDPSNNKGDGTIRWSGPKIAEFTLDKDFSGTEVNIAQLITPHGGEESGQARIEVFINGITRYSHVIQMVTPGLPRDITHVSWGWMYGGDTPAYGPNGLDMTVVDISDFQVVEL